MEIRAAEMRSPPGYLDTVAKRSRAQAGQAFPGLTDSLAKALKTCGGRVKTGTCGEHHVAKILFCGREGCPRCGVEDSSSHRRRYARLIPRAQKMAEVQYWVITWPDEGCEALRSTSALTKAGKAAAEAFKSLGYARGLRRWHFRGDKSDRWRPHLNVLVDGGWMAPERLAEVKGALRLALGLPSNGIINCHFVKADDPKRVSKILHHLKYITRPTFGSALEDPDMANRLEGFRNTSWWGPGKWRGPDQWEIGDQEASGTRRLVTIEAGKCPECGGRVEWEKDPVALSSLEATWEPLDLGNGYLLLRPRP